MTKTYYVGICLSIYDRHDRHVSRQKYASTHSCIFYIYREREGVPTPQNYGPMGSNSMVRRDFSHVDIPVLSPVSRVKKGAT